MSQRLLFLLRLYLTLILIFLMQKVIFVAVNAGHADAFSFGRMLSLLWHGLRLDSVAACYLLAVPLLVVLVSCFFQAFPLRKVLTFWYILSAPVMALAFVADTVLYYYWGAKLDAAEFIYAAKPHDMLASLSWWMALLGILIVALLTWHYLRRQRHATPTSLDALRRRWSSLLYLPLGALLFLGMRGSLSESTANPSYAYHSTSQFCNHSALNPLFNIVHSLFKVEDLQHEFQIVAPDEAERLVSPSFASSPLITDTLLTVRRPNILMVIWEGGGWDMVMNDSVGHNISRLASEGVCFTNCWANSFRTDRGLVSILSGWMGLPTASLMKMNDKCRRLPGLARTLRDNGYTTAFHYGGDIDFTNMRGYLHETGFDAVSGAEDYPSSRRLSSWGAPDAYTILPHAIPFGHAASPAFHAILTLSSHEPWEVPSSRLADRRKNAFAYTDSCLGVLVDSLRALPVWDSLLLIIVPDHGVPLVSSQSTGDPSVAHIPVVWAGGALRRHAVVDCRMMQSDIVATLLAQMEINSDPFPFSRNVLSPAYGSMPHFAIHSFKNGCNYIDSSGIVRFDCTDRSVTPLTGSDDTCRLHFVKVLVQYIYQITAQL